MTEPRGVYIPADDLYRDAVRVLGEARLLQIVTAIEDIQRDTGYGEAVILIQDHRVYRVSKKINYQ